MKSKRNIDLGIIHMAKKQLDMDDDTYTDIVIRVGKAPSGSSKDLSAAGRARVIAHMESCGFQRKRKPRAAVLATTAQIRMIYKLWHELGEAGLVEHPTREALSAWIKRQSGVPSAGDLSKEEASEIIEQLKAWKARGKI